MKKLLFGTLCLLFTFYVHAQDTAATKMNNEATGLRSNEKIYVVVAVLTTILAGLFIYIIRLDRKISRMEKG